MFNSLHCPYCLSEHIEAHSDYETKQNGCRTLYRCTACQWIFSEMKNTLVLRGFLWNLHVGRAKA